MGYRHIDCASVYGNEKEIGAVLQEVFSEGIVTREELWITSKVWNDKHKQVVESCKTNACRPATRLSRFGIWSTGHSRTSTRPKW